MEGGRGAEGAVETTFIIYSLLSNDNDVHTTFAGGNNFQVGNFPATIVASQSSHQHFFQIIDVTALMSICVFAAQFKFVYV